VGAIAPNGYAYAVVAVLNKRNYQFKNNLDMKNENNNTPRTKAMPYDAVLPTVNDECEGDSNDWYDEEDYYYQCMCCGKAQSKFNGGSCYLCASPVQKITF
jgi:hypothetical protein